MRSFNAGSVSELRVAVVFMFSTTRPFSEWKLGGFSFFFGAASVLVLRSAAVRRSVVGVRSTALPSLVVCMAATEPVTLRQRCVRARGCRNARMLINARFPAVKTDS